jgi:hypothetical protein
MIIVSMIHSWQASDVLRNVLIWIIISREQVSCNFQELILFFFIFKIWLSSFSSCYCQNDEEIIKQFSYQSLMYYCCDLRPCPGDPFQKCADSHRIRFEKIFCMYIFFSNLNFKVKIFHRIWFRLLDIENGLDCPDVSPIDRELECRLTVKINANQTVKVLVDYGDGHKEEVNVNQTSIFIRHKYNAIANYSIECSVIESNRNMSEKVYIRRNKDYICFLILFWILLIKLIFKQTEVIRLH